MANFQLNGTDIKNPSSYKVSRFKISNLERLANAEMAGDLIAKKLKFFFTYETIGEDDWKVIEDILWDDNMFYELTYPGGDGPVTVYAGEIPSELHWLEEDGKKIWKNVTFDLIQK